MKREISQYPLRCVASWTFGPGIDQPLAMNRGGVMHYYLADGLGSIRALADSAGNVDQAYEYSVFGEITAQSGGVENPFTYTAREWEPEVGLYYYRARWYEAQVGRFVSEDPIGFGGGDANLYRYVRNGPATATDPAGQSWCYVGCMMYLAVVCIPATGICLMCAALPQPAAAYCAATCFGSLYGACMGVAHKECTKQCAPSCPE